MDGSCQQDRKALTAEGDLWPGHQGTVPPGARMQDHHFRVEATAQHVLKELFYKLLYIKSPDRCTLLKCTSSRPKTTMLGTTGVKSITRTSLTAAPLTWRLKVCEIARSHVSIYNTLIPTDMFLLPHRNWTGLAEHWYPISFQKKVWKNANEDWCCSSEGTISRYIYEYISSVFCRTVSFCLFKLNKPRDTFENIWQIVLTN